MNCKYAILDDRCILHLSGADCESFLQGLITNNVPTNFTTAPANAIFSALLSPQGKVLFDFILISTKSGYLIDVSSELAEDLMNKLFFYRLRVDVKVHNISENKKIIAVWDGRTVPDDSQLCFEDPRFPSLGQRMILDLNETEIFQADENHVRQSLSDYHRHRTSFGVPELGRDLAAGSYFPHDICLDLLNGVDFNKGCFIGQEVVSRMRHRGTVRKRVVLIRAESPMDILQSDIQSDNRALGTVFSANETQGAGIVRLDRVRDALGREEGIYCGPVKLQLKSPPWSNYELIPER